MDIAIRILNVDTFSLRRISDGNTDKVEITGASLQVEFGDIAAQNEGNDDEEPYDLC